MDLESVIAFLLTQDRAAVVSALQNKAQPLFQTIFDKGHSDATARAKGKVDEAELKLTTAIGDLTKAQEQIVTLGKDKPDVQKYIDRVTTLEGELKSTKETAAKEVGAIRVNVEQSNLRAQLLALSVDPEYAEVLVSKDAVRQRIVQREDKIEVIGPNGIPFTPVDGKSGVQLLAAELVTKVPPKFLVSGVDRGSGIKIPGAGGETDAAAYDAIRKEVNDRKPSGPVGTEALGKRLGMSPATT